MKRNKDNNIIIASLEELTELGYKPQKLVKDRKGNVEPPKPKSLLCLTEKSKDLWAEMSSADIEMGKINCEKFLVLEKV